MTQFRAGRGQCSGTCVDPDDVDWNELSNPFPGVVPTWTAEELEEQTNPGLQLIREQEAELRQRELDREIEAKANAVLRSMPRRRKRWAEMRRDWARQKLAQRPKTQLVFPSPREHRAAPARRPGSRRTTVSTRGSPDDSGESDPDGEQHPPAVRGTAGTAL